MSRVGAFFHWLATPFRAARTLFPLSHEGRQTLIYLVFAGAGPALTLLAMWIMARSLEKQALWPTFTETARIVSWSLLIIVCGLGMFVSIRAIKIGKDGFEASGRDAPEAAQKVADAAQEKSDEIAEKAQ